MHRLGKQNLDQLATEFTRLARDIASVAAPPTLLVFNNLYSVRFAGDGRRCWAVGARGTILRLDPPDLAVLSAAVDLKGVKAPLGALSISDQAIGPSMDIMKVFETDREDRLNEIKRDEVDLRRASPPSLISVKSDPLEILYLYRTVWLFWVNILGSVYRYSLRSAAHYDARADALSLSSALLDRSSINWYNNCR